MTDTTILPIGDDRPRTPPNVRLEPTRMMPGQRILFNGVDTLGAKRKKAPGVLVSIDRLSLSMCAPDRYVIRLDGQGEEVSCLAGELIPADEEPTRMTEPENAVAVCQRHGLRVYFGKVIADDVAQVLAQYEAVCEEQAANLQRYAESEAQHNRTDPKSRPHEVPLLKVAA